MSNNLLLVVVGGLLLGNIFRLTPSSDLFTYGIQKIGQPS
jgi:hypothetical protein